MAATSGVAAAPGAGGPLSCRFYESPFPDVDSLVMVKIANIAEVGAYVTLPEYNNIEGMILLSEVSRKRIPSITKLVRVGRMEVCLVLLVDKEKGYIDLSKRRVSASDIEKTTARYAMARGVNSILYHVAEVHNVPLLHLYERIAWPLARKYTTAYEGFSLAVFSDDIFKGLDIEPHLRDAVLAEIRRKMAKPPVKVRADVEVTCFAYEGIDAIQFALRKGLATSTDKLTVDIRLVAPPLYLLFTTATDAAAGVAKLEEAIAAVREAVVSKHGDLVVKEAPRAVTQEDDRDLVKYLARLEKRGADVAARADDSDESGDDDDDEDEDDEDANASGDEDASGDDEEGDEIGARARGAAKKKAAARKGGKRGARGGESDDAADEDGGSGEGAAGSDEGAVSEGEGGGEKGEGDDEEEAATATATAGKAGRFGKKSAKAAGGKKKVAFGGDEELGGEEGEDEASNGRASGRDDADEDEAAAKARRKKQAAAAGGGAGAKGAAAGKAGKARART